VRPVGSWVLDSGNVVADAESWHPLGTFNNLLQPVVLSLASIDGGGLIAGTTNGIYGYPKNVYPN
tara:strand:- start:53 stop:247 length:195 start_codon:yes stop_codon:yes gene_type:complete